MSDMTLLPLDDRYNLEVLLSDAGGFSDVWRGRDTRLDRPVAVKLLRVDGDLASLEREALEEARRGGTLRHSNIVVVHDIGTINGQSAIVMELATGSLAELMRQRKISDELSLTALRQCLKGLSYLHTVGIHRDIKPANILVFDDTFKIGDFGLAKLFNEQSSRHSGGVGTPGYMPPEQVQGSPLTPRADIYALSCIAYECFAGVRVFEADNPWALAFKHVHHDPKPLSMIRPDLPRPVLDVIMAGLSKAPGDRPESAQAMLESLNRDSVVMPALPHTANKTAMMPTEALRLPADARTMLIPGRQRPSRRPRVDRWLKIGDRTVSASSRARGSGAAPRLVTSRDVVGSSDHHPPQRERARAGPRAVGGRSAIRLGWRAAKGGLVILAVASLVLLASRVVPLVAEAAGRLLDDDRAGRSPSTEQPTLAPDYSQVPRSASASPTGSLSASPPIESSSAPVISSTPSFQDRSWVAKRSITLTLEWESTYHEVRRHTFFVRNVTLAKASRLQDSRGAPNGFAWLEVVAEDYGWDNDGSICGIELDRDVSGSVQIQGRSYPGTLFAHSFYAGDAVDGFQFLIPETTIAGSITLWITKLGNRCTPQTPTSNKETIEFGS